ncbi:MAG: hypothetical protein ABH846_00295 [Patescibacteria group bacterium]
MYVSEAQGGSVTRYVGAGLSVIIIASLLSFTMYSLLPDSQVLEKATAAGRRPESDPGQLQSEQPTKLMPIPPTSTPSAILEQAEEGEPTRELTRAQQIEWELTHIELLRQDLHARIELIETLAPIFDDDVVPRREEPHDWTQDDRVLDEHLRLEEEDPDKAAELAEIMDRVDEIATVVDEMDKEATREGQQIIEDGRWTLDAELRKLETREAELLGELEAIYQMRQ